MAKKKNIAISSEKKALAQKSIRVAFCASFTLLGLKRVFVERAAQLGIAADVYVNEYRYQEEILNDASALYQFAPDIVFLSVDTRTLLGDVFFTPHALGAITTDDAKTEWAAELLQPLERAIARLGARATVVVSNFEVPRHSPFGILESKQSFGIQEAVERLNQRLRELYRSMPNVFVFDYNGFVAQFGAAAVFDPKLYYLGDARIAASHLPQLADAYLAYVRPRLALSKKCIVLDLDNTLWGGILGEDGTHGIVLGPTPAGRPFWEFQKHLAALARRGIILAINSKNNLADVEKLWREHPHMVLKKNDFAAHRINWLDKASNMRSLAEELNIGLDSFVFIDDDPVNRQLIRALLPMVVVLDVPEDPALYPDMLTSRHEFHVLQLTDEDRERNAMYIADRQRKELKTSVGDFEDFLASLDLRIEVLPANETTIPRIAQLSGKTNQFNLMTRRYTEDDIRRFAKSSDHIVRAFRVIDRFGDYGITGVVVVRRAKSDWHIDEFLLSCRVLGKEVERAIMGHVLRDARAAKAKQVIGYFSPTPKNDPAKDFYSRVGFRAVRGGTKGVLRYSFRVGGKYKEPKFITIK